MELAKIFEERAKASPEELFLALLHAHLPPQAVVSHLVDFTTAVLNTYEEMKQSSNHDENATEVTVKDVLHTLFTRSAEREIPVPQVRRESAASKIAQRIYDRVNNGIYVDKLPQAKDLADEFCVSVSTIYDAYNLLDRQGVVEKIRGRGIFVRGQRENKQKHPIDL